MTAPKNIPKPEPVIYVVEGSPIAEEMHRMLRPYSSGSNVRSILLRQVGIDVQYEDGGRVFFVAVPEGQSLIATPEGKLVVTGEEKADG